MADEKTERVTVYLTKTQRERLGVIKAKRETDTDTRTMSWLVDDEWRRIVDHDTKDDKLNRLEAGQNAQQVQLDEIKRLLALLQSEKWAQMAPPDGQVRVSISLDPTDMERLLQAVKARG